jgi:hypothetical protein
MEMSRSEAEVYRRLKLVDETQRLDGMWPAPDMLATVPDEWYVSVKEPT